MTQEVQNISRVKKLAFTLILFLLPLAFIVALELTLELFHYGGNLDLFVRTTTGKKTEFVLNKNVTKRYFFQKGIKTPIPLSQSFSAHKDSSTYRIFCLGASTTQGFPYPPNGGYPAQLENILMDIHPQKNIEVLNCGITAITSHSVLDLEREVLKKYQPDLLIIYSGHNEFYGVFGQASTLSLFQNRTLLKTFLKLQRTKLVLLTRNILNQFLGKKIERKPDEESQTLMRIMAKDVNIKFDSKTVQRAQDTYYENLVDMCKLAQKHRTDIMFCTLVDNEKDFPPFASAHMDNFKSTDSLSWSEDMRDAKVLFDSGKFTDAIDYYQKALQLDSTFAMTHFLLAHCYMSLGEFESAKHHFQLAKDFDVVRFRAPSSFNDIITRVTQDFHIPLIDTKGAFDKKSPGGITGNNLVHEHVHPNLYGYTLLARTIAEAMSDNAKISKHWNWNACRSDSAYEAKTHITLLDHEVVNYTLYRLMSQWPFPPTDSSVAYKRIGTERTEELAKSLVDKNEKSLVELHLEYGNDFHQKNELDAALAEYKAALAIEPLAATYNRLGRVYLRKTELLFREQKDYQTAYESFLNGVTYFSEGLERWPNDIGLNFNLGLLYSMRTDKLDSAVVYFTKVIALDARHKNAHLQLVELYLRQQNFDKAKTLAQKSIQLFPDEARFCTDFGVILIHEQNWQEAENWLNKAVMMNNDRRALHYLQLLQNRKNTKTAN